MVPELPANPVWILLHAWPPRIDVFVYRDVVVNIALYIPAGLTGHLAFRRFGKMWLSIGAPVLICTLLSASVEMIQLFVPSRNTSALDLLTNIFGSIAGVVLGIVMEEVVLKHGAAGARRNSGKSRKASDRAALWLLVCCAGWLLFPLVPVLGRTPLRHKLEIFIHSPATELVPILSAAIVWFVAGSLLQASAFSSPRRLTILSVILVPMQLAILYRQPGLSELAGAAVGAACFAIFWPKRRAERPGYRKIQAWAFLCMIVVRGLAPFVFAPGALPFSWIPFAGFLGTEWQIGIQLIAEKFFWYGTAIWLLRASGIRIRNATALVVATLLAIELAQTHIPGRTAEITDPLWGIFAGVSLLIVSRSARPEGAIPAGSPMRWI